MKSVMAHQFSMVPKAEIPRSTFNRTHGHKTTFDSGYIVPFLIDEGLPGDTFSVSGTFMMRMATPIYPVMDNLFADIHWFAVPVRLLWDNWAKFNGAQDNPGDSTDYTIPVTAAASWAEGSLGDYLGLPTGLSIQVNALPFRGFNLIYNEWYRDQNLIDSINCPKDDGPDPVANYVLRKRNKRHDYFTSALPWPQKSDAGSVTIPLGTTAPITGIGKTDQTFVAGGNAYETDGTGTVAYTKWQNLTSTMVAEEDPNNAGFLNIRADLTNASAATINQLRQSFQVQKLYERDARGGTRLQEVIKSHFGVTSPDYRMQRPEYLGGSTMAISVNPVQQTSSTDVTSPQGNLAAFAVGGGQSGFTKSFTEHVYIYGLVSVRADLTYQQGLERMWSRSTRFDFYWPALAHIGEQAILNKEIYYQNAAADEEVFGYQERFGEMRYKPSRISGAFRSNAATPLDSWHLSQEFGSLPTLDQTFIEENPPVDRVVAVPSEPEFLFDSYIQMRCARPMPVYGVPGMIDRF